MIRKYHNHTLHTIPRHSEEEPQITNRNKIRKKLKQSNQLSIPQQDGCKTRKDTCIPKQRPNTEPPQTMEGTTEPPPYNGQQQKHCLRTDSGQSYWDLNAFNWYQIFALDSGVVKEQNMLSSHRGFLPYTMYHHREIIYKINTL